MAILRTFDRNCVNEFMVCISFFGCSPFEQVEMVIFRQWPLLLQVSSTQPEHSQNSANPCDGLCFVVMVPSLRSGQLRLYLLLGSRHLGSVASFRSLNLAEKVRFELTVVFWTTSI
jgi:hypothetical protein